MNRRCRNAGMPWILLSALLVCRCGIDPLSGGSGTETTGGVRASIIDSEGKPVPGASIQLLPSSYNHLYDSVRIAARSATTDRDGIFEIRDLAPDEYTIEARGEPRQAILFAGKVREGEVNDLGQHRIKAVGRMRISVRNVHLYDTLTLKASLHGTRRALFISPRASFEFDTLAPGDYRIHLTTSMADITGSADLFDTVRENAVTDIGNVSLPIDFHYDSLVVAAFLAKQGIAQPYRFEDFITVTGNRIRALDLTQRGITELDTAIAGLDFIYNLKLDSNRLTGLPEALASLRLRGLSLNDNPLDTFPDVLVRLQTHRFSIDRTGITALPAALKENIGLDGISMESNNLDSIPPVIYEMTDLMFLSFGGNNISEIAPAIGGLAALESLALESNQLTSLPDEIGQLIDLKRLFLYNNAIDSLPHTIGQCQALQSLHMYNNNMTALPAEIGQCGALTQLVVSSNRISSLPVEIMDLPDTIRLTIVNNKLCDVSSEIGEWIDKHSENENWRDSQECP